MKKVVVIGGGTGSVSVLEGLREYEDIDLKVVVSMTDDGGSQKVIRDEFGLLPYSDVRKSIIALSEYNEELMRNLFTYRFSKGEGISGHTMGNLIMIALGDITGSEEDGIEAACKIFNVHGKVLPVTYNNVKLVGEYDDGSKLEGESYIDGQEEVIGKKLVNMYTTPRSKANPKVIFSILEADYLIFGPGDLYTSTLANVVVDGVSEAIEMSGAKKIFVNNLMTNHSQTWWMKGSDIMKEVEKYAKTKMDFVVQNNREIPTEILEKYEASGEHTIEDDFDSAEIQAEVVREDIIGDDEITKASGDTLKRSLVRHDGEKLGKVLHNIITN